MEPCGARGRGAGRAPRAHPRVPMAGSCHPASWSSTASGRGPPWLAALVIDVAEVAGDRRRLPLLLHDKNDIPTRPRLGNGPGLSDARIPRPAMRPFPRRDCRCCSVLSHISHHHRVPGLWRGAWPREGWPEHAAMEGATIGEPRRRGRVLLLNAELRTTQGAPALARLGAELECAGFEGVWPCERSRSAPVRVALCHLMTWIVLEGGCPPRQGAVAGLARPISPGETEFPRQARSAREPGPAGRAAAPQIPRACGGAVSTGHCVPGAAQHRPGPEVSPVRVDMALLATFIRASHDIEIVLCALGRALDLPASSQSCLRLVPRPRRRYEPEPRAVPRRWRAHGVGGHIRHGRLAAAPRNRGKLRTRG